MQNSSILLFGLNGYVGGTIADAAKQEGRTVIGVGSNDFPFWEDTDTWPVHLLSQPADVAVLAASFEKPVSRDKTRSSEELRHRFSVLLEMLRARRIIFLSSDAVFDGRNGPYIESDERSPATPYGTCKRIMEDAVAQFKNAHVIRPSVVWGVGVDKQDSRRKRFLEREAGRIPGAVNVYRSPIEVHLLARAVMRASRELELPRILHLATPRMRYIEFLRTCLIPDAADRIDPWIDPEFAVHDTSLGTSYPDLAKRLLP